MTRQQQRRPSSVALATDPRASRASRASRVSAKCAEMGIDAYDVREAIGKGGFGSVFHAVSRADGAHVAVKVIDKRAMRSAHLVRRVRNEVEIHSLLRHPSVSELHDFFEDSRNVYLVLELCDGGDLGQYVKRHGALSECDARRLFAQVVDGVAYLHSIGIMHRDLKLSNILLTQDDMCAKIADFGLAARLDDANDKRDTLCGTPNFISPEIVARLPHGRACDVWSLGCILYTLLVGVSPFEGEGVEATLERVRRCDYVIPSTVSSQAADLISRLLESDPERRPILRDVIAHPFLAGAMPLFGSTGVGPECNPYETPVVAGGATTLGSSVRDSGLASSHVSSVRRRTMATDDGKPGVNRELFAAKAKGLQAEGVSGNRQGDRAGNCPLAPLNGRRLRPMRQEAKNVVLAVETGGHVRLEFMRDGAVYEVFRVESDGLTISIKQATDVAQTTYSLESLPIRYRRKYAYAAKFCSLVRSKTPKVTYYSDLAACILYENEPSPDFEARFYSGARLHRSAVLVATADTHAHAHSHSTNNNGVAAYVYKVTEADGTQHVIGGSTSQSNITPAVTLLLAHAAEGLKRCAAIEAGLSALEGASGTADTAPSFFPVTVSRRPAAVQTVQTAAEQKSQSAPLPSGTDHSALASHVRSTTQPPPTHAPAEAGCTRAVGVSAVSSVGASSSRRSASSCAPIVWASCLGGVVWGMQLSNGEVWLLFADGVRMGVAPSGLHVTIVDAKGTLSRMAIDASLPDDAKRRLAQLKPLFDSVVAPAHTTHPCTHPASSVV